MVLDPQMMSVLALACVYVGSLSAIGVAGGQVVLLQVDLCGAIAMEIMWGYVEGFLRSPLSA